MARFFQPFILDHQHERLDIPVAFTPRLSGVREVAKVRRCGTNMTWDVRIIETTNRDGYSHMQMTEGWSRVVLDNNMQRGDFLVFRFYGNSVFGLTVYEPSGCVRDIQHFGPALATPQVGRTPTWQTNNDEPSMVAACFANNSVQPSFIVKMNECYLQTGAVNISFTFAREHLRTTTDTLIVLRHDGNHYEVIIRTYKNDKGTPYVCKMKSGFLHFARTLNLTPRDVCTFEMLPIDDMIAFNVTIFNYP